MNRLATSGIKLSQCSRTITRHRTSAVPATFHRHKSSKADNNHGRSLRSLEAIADLAKDPSDYPNLMEKDRALDDFETMTFPPNNKTPFENKVIIRNRKSIFDPHAGLSEEERAAQKRISKHKEGHVRGGIKGADDIEGLMDKVLEGEVEAQVEEEELIADEITEGFEETEETRSREDEQEMDSGKKLDLLTDVDSRTRAGFYLFPLVRRVVKHQTGKGKVARISVLVVIGNGKGLVGYGEAKDDEGDAAHSKSVVQAYKNMDHVERFEQRTVWTEMSTKLGATKLVVRPRPVGFGLRCNPYVHQVLKAAGIKDASVKVWGSRNPGNVIKALFRILHAGNAPLAMGNGVGGGAKKLEKGVGMRSAGDIERERGRRMVQLVKRY